MYRKFIAFILVVAGAHQVAARDIVCFEAEATQSIEAPMQQASFNENSAAEQRKVAEAASGKSYLEIPQGKGNPPEILTGKAEWKFSVAQDEDYFMWCRVWWVDSCGNSLSVSVDGAKPFALGQDATFKAWHWVKAPARLTQLDLTKGPHTLKISNREDGVKIDQILLVDDKRYVPVDTETTTQPGH